MTADVWNQWRALAAGAGFPGVAAPFGETPFGDATSFGDVAARFAAAAKRFTEAASNPSAADEAARAFSQFLREQSGAPPGSMPWEGAPDLPALGLLREHQRRAERAADAARRMHEAQRRLQVLWSDVLRDAATAFAARVSASAVGTAEAASPRALYDSWIECAEAAYAGTAHSDAFCDALADFVNAEAQWRAEIAAAVEHGSKALDLPARGEFNSLALRLKAVEELLRTERRRQHASQKTATGRKPRPRRAKRAPKK